MANTKQGTILVVDDEEIMREILETLLTRAGYDVRLASSGTEGLELARALPFDAAIVDIMMPGLDGYETARRIRAVDPDLPLIGQTAHAMQEDRAHCIEAGMVDRVTKPIDTEELVRSVLRHARRG